jgi:hypothetical protein
MQASAAWASYEEEEQQHEAFLRDMTPLEDVCTDKAAIVKAVTSTE